VVSYVSKRPPPKQNAAVYPDGIQHDEKHQKQQFQPLEQLSPRRMSVSNRLLELSTKVLRRKQALGGISKRIQMRVLEMEIMIFNDDNEVASSTCRRLK
jgi:hypothetical protein